MVDAPFNCCLPYVCVGYTAIALSPPKVITALHITRDEKDSKGNLQLMCERQTIRIVIVVSIVEGERQGRTSVIRLLPILRRHVEFFQCRLKMKYPVVAAQVKQV